MTDFRQRISNLSSKQLILLADQLNSRIEKSGLDTNAPIAVIGAGCKFPGGADSPERYWNLIVEGYDGTEEVGPDRWDIDRYYDPDPDAPGKMNTRRGGFIHGMDHFDAEFFGISPREAISMDPQHRLLLEVAWETLEYAGINPRTLSGSQTGVFVGICNSDYFQLMNRNTDAIDAYLATGSAHSIASGRISYALNLGGPSISVDTACSSSLVAVHLACQSLRLGECRLALAGGVNVIATPETTITLSKSHLMAPDGRCKTFDQTADGFVRSEGCGLVALKKLSDAQADGDTIMAVILGTATNQDGRSGGIAAPNGPAQTTVIQRALKNAKLSPADIDYIEAHGTGTALGDPIEVLALQAVFAKDRDPQDPLIVGSVKTNIGHAESAAGIAGLIKLVLSIQHRHIPPHLYCNIPNPEIPWASLPFEIPVSGRPWPQRGDRIGGVSSFGFSGTNVHIIVGQAPDKPAPLHSETTQPQIIALSATHADSLKTIAANCAQFLRKESAPVLQDFCQTLTRGRAHFKYRAAFVADSLQTAREGLAAIAGGLTDNNSLHMKDPTAADKFKIAFLFTGQGSQYVGMGQALLKQHRVFRETMEKCDAILSPLIDRSLMDLLYSELQTPPLLNQTRYTQPVLFALEYSLAALWRHWGLEPAAVMGHSLGEYIAACVAGLFSLEDGLKLIAKRAELMQTAPGNGGMAAVLASEMRLRNVLSDFETALAVAAVNGPEQTVISGDLETLNQFLAVLEKNQIRFQRLNVSHAFHSKLMKPAMEAFARAIESVHFEAPKIPIVSNVTGDFAGPGLMNTAAYWPAHTLNPVQCLQSFRTLHAAGFRRFLEIGPQPILCGLGRQSLQDDSIDWLCSLDRRRNDNHHLSGILASLYAGGADFRWDAVHGPAQTEKLPLPTYPFRRKRYWLPDIKSGQNAVPAYSAVPVAADSLFHPLLGCQLSSPALKDSVFESLPSLEKLPFLKDHTIFGQCIMPTPAYLEMALAVNAQMCLANQSPENCGLEISDIHVDSALPLADSVSVKLQTVVSPVSNHEYEVRFYSTSLSEPSKQWHLHAGCRISSLLPKPSPPPVDIAAFRQRCTTEWTGEQFYSGLDELGLNFGQTFKGLQHIWRRDGEALGKMSLPIELLPDRHNFRFHPALLDACFHLAGAAISENIPRNPYLLIGIERMRLLADPPDHFWNLVHLNGDTVANAESLSVNLVLFDGNGSIFAEIENVLLRRTNPEAFQHMAGKKNLKGLLYAVAWEEMPLPDDQAIDKSIELPTASALVPDLRDLLRQHARQFGLSVYNELIPILDRICTRAVCNMLQKAGIALIPGTEFQFDAVCARLNLLPRHRRLLHRLMTIMIEDGIVEASNGGYRVLMLDNDTASMPTEDELLQSFPACEGEVRLTLGCLRHLPQILSGEIEPLHILFPDGDTALAEKVYSGSPYAKTFNSVLGRAVSAEVGKRLEIQPTVRILEIGAGTGGTTAHVVSVLPENGIEYTFSDISPLFIHRAEQTYQRFPYFSYRLLDIEADPDDQGFAENRFDIVIAANIVHATRNLNTTMAHIQKLLVPNGLLLMLEGTAPQRWVDVTFGLTEGWWHFEDTDLRPSYPLISSTVWKQLLSRIGMEAAAITLDAPAALGDVLRQVLIAARNQPGIKPDESHDSWTLFTNDANRAASFSRAVGHHGGISVDVRFAADYQPVGEGRGTVRSSVPEDYSNVLRSLIPSADPASSRNILFSADLDPTSGSELKIAATLHALLYLMQAMVEADTPENRFKLWVCTENGQAVLPMEQHINPAQSALWGLARVFSLEHPSLFGGLIDVDIETEMQATMDLVIRHIRAAASEDQIAFRNKKRLVARLAMADTIQRSEHPFVFKPEASYLITGGTGGLGLELAQWMAEKGAARIYLLSRKQIPDRDSWHTIKPGTPLASLCDRIIRIEADTGFHIELLQCDAGDRNGMIALLAELKARKAFPLKGVIHAAVEMSSVPISRMTTEMLDRMLHAKVGGAVLIDELTRDLEMDFFVLFSSTTALWGVAGLGHYAAANQFLDALAHQRRAEGRPALSINWGTWAEMRVATDAEKAGFSQAGLNPLPLKTALSALEQTLHSDLAQICVASVAWPRLRAVYEARRSRPFFNRMTIGQHNAASIPEKMEVNDLLQQLAEASEDRRRVLLKAHLEQCVRHILRLEKDAGIDPEKGLFDMGMDSLMAVELKSRLEKDTGMTLPSTLTFNYPTISDLSGFFWDRLYAAVSPPAAETNIPLEKTAPTIPVETDAMSEDELSDMLMRKLEELK